MVFLEEAPFYRACASPCRHNACPARLVPEDDPLRAGNSLDFSQRLLCVRLCRGKKSGSVFSPFFHLCSIEFSADDREKRYLEFFVGKVIKKNGCSNFCFACKIAVRIH
ncbi:MAG: hypothetical protein ACREX0_07270 [Noviherbaspirillum sp.]